MSWSLKNACIRALSVCFLASLFGCSAGLHDIQRRTSFVDSHPEISETMAQSILDEQRRYEALRFEIADLVYQIGVCLDSRARPDKDHAAAEVGVA